MSNYCRILIGSYRRIDDVTNTLFNLYYIKQFGSMLPCFCSVTGHRRRQNVVKTSVMHAATASRATFFVLTTG